MGSVCLTAGSQNLPRSHWSEAEFVPPPWPTYGHLIGWTRRQRSGPMAALMNIHDRALGSQRPRPILSGGLIGSE